MGHDDGSKSRGGSSQSRSSRGSSFSGSGFQPGDVIADRYRVKKRLGKGGMGQVYLVEDTKTQQILALKTLLPQYLTNEHAVKRFVREVKAVRNLDHPSIVRIYDARRVGSTMFYTMDYVEGKSLFHYIRDRGKLGFGSTVRILSLLCHALEHAHKHTIHRDISPDNVMILADGNIKLLDFGLAKLTDTDQAFTRIGVSLGKMQYMAPEQRISAAEVDLRADLYSLGVMFHEMLTGELPKEGVRISSLVPGIPKECDAFAEKAMSRDPNLRYQSAAEMRRELMAIYEKTKQSETQPPTLDQTAAARPSMFGRVLDFFKRIASPRRR